MHFGIILLQSQQASLTYIFLQCTDHCDPNKPTNIPNYTGVYIGCPGDVMRHTTIAHSQEEENMPKTINQNIPKKNNYLVNYLGSSSVFLLHAF